MKKIKFLIGALPFIATISNSEAGRTLTALVTPYSEQWYDDAGEAVWFECSLSNISGVEQNVLVTAQSAESSPATSINALGTCATPCAVPQLPDSGPTQTFQMTLAPEASSSFYWRKAENDPTQSAVFFPRRIVFEVSEDRCAINWKLRALLPQHQRPLDEGPRA